MKKYRFSITNSYEKENPMTFKQLQYVIEISKCTSLTQAAKNLYVSQPNLSKAIQELEDEFGIKILTRGRSGIAFTSEGTDFILYATHILDQIDTMYDCFCADRIEETAYLNISSQHYIFVADAVSSMIKRTEKDKHIKINYLEKPTSQIIDDIRDRTSQIGILFLSELNRGFMNNIFSKNAIEFTPLFSTRPCAYLNFDHPLAGKRSLTVNDLEEYPYVCYTQGLDSPRYSEEVLSPQSPKQIIYVEDTSSMMHIIKTSNAYNIGTGCNIDGFMNDDYRVIPVNDLVHDMTLGWIKLKDFALSSETIMFIECLKESISKCTYISNKK